VLGYGENTAGGIMTTVVAVAEEAEVVGGVVERLRTLDAHRADVDAVLVVDADGRLLDDVSLFELVTATNNGAIGELVGPPWPIVVSPDASLGDVVDAVLSNRRSSVVVVDDHGRPIGRILVDDVLDALVPRAGRLHRDVGEQ
jgi:Mg/Co/Ni transporter MgtE